MVQRTRWLRLAGASLVVASSGCFNSDSDGPAQSRVLDGNHKAALLQAKDCPDLLDKLQADAIAKLDLEIALFKSHLEADRSYGETAAGGGTGSGGPTRSAGGFDTDDNDLDGLLGDLSSGGNGGEEFPSPSAPPALEGGESQNSGDPKAPVGGSDTNNQVKDVDEADFVKLARDKQRFYLLHGTQLFAFESWPAESLAALGSPLSIEGNPREMFVHDGKALVFSEVNASDVEGEQAYDSQRYYQAYTKLTLVKLTGLRTLRELYVEGHYTSSRRYDSLVRVVMQAESPAPNRFYPNVQLYDDWGRLFDDEAVDAQLDAWRERTVSSIESTELSDWLPRRYERTDGKNVAVAPACGSHYTPVAGTTDYGLTRLLSLDLSDAQADPQELTVLGASSIVYSNTDTMVLAHNDYRWQERDFGVVDEQRTALHSFRLSADETRYEASGWASGHVLNQFAVKEKQGVVLVSTSGMRRSHPDASRDSAEFWQREPVNQVIALSAKGSELEVRSSSGPIGHEGETTQSTRFVGDRAYVVTFRQVDPLIVVSTEDADALKVHGELNIPGFSEYMHPLGDDHLLTIGQNGNDDGLTGGLALQIFDVSDDNDPKLVHKEALGSGSSSQASYDHKAFTFYAAQGLLALPVVENYEHFNSTLQVFRVSTDDGIEQLGAVSHTELFSDACKWVDEWGYSYFQCAYDPGIRRGMFVQGEDETFVYAVSYAGVTAHAVGDLASPLASEKLPEPSFYYGDYYYGGDDVESFPRPGSTGGGPMNQGDIATQPTPDAPDEQPDSEGTDAGAADPDTGTTEGVEADPAG